MSNRPENMSVYDELDLKLGIKSSTTEALRRTLSI